MMKPGERLRATYEFRPCDHLVRREFYIWNEAIERWKREGLPDDYEQRNVFQFDPPATIQTNVNLGWCEPPFLPAYEERLIEQNGETEIIQDNAGRWLRVFKGRRHGFMPEYIKHPVSNERDWSEHVQPRLDPNADQRHPNLERDCKNAAQHRSESEIMVSQNIIGGYMYLRALMGPEDLLYAFHDQPQLIHIMMRQWVRLVGDAMERIQAHIELDEIVMAEDICYNHGLLIAPAMVREFLLPYYAEMVSAARRRQQRRIYMIVDTDGWAAPAIPLYRAIGMDAMMPFEVASGCDVVAMGREWPDLVLLGGIDKRVLAAGPAAIDRHLAHILPAMRARGGYIPTCDHGVPDDVSLENYLYYRKRVCEMDH